ncbi:MAG: hypothetical protein SAJ37_11400 [Oscillatoria sp. PMC 1068.18]|nr:hypothetical protein [Oscillatoria sp. PMC 1076.18]MEC4989344.1 hypothetical protein [Oscillatoria sp. PMC 1068.18]
MDKIKRSLFQFRFGLAAVTLGISILGLTAPATQAREIILRRETYLQRPVQQPAVNYIYGSPIPTPVPVNPVTGVPSIFEPRYRGVVPSPNINPINRSRIRNSTLVNPTVINSDISDSVLINPVIVNPVNNYSGYPTQRRVNYGYPPSVRIQVGY